RQVLRKTDGLTAEEMNELRGHPKVGANLVGKIPELAGCAKGILHHHEHYDGGGYPDGLKGEKIPLEARIIAVADAFVNMTERHGMTPKEAIDELKRRAGKEFDPNLVEQFVTNYSVSTSSTRKEKKDTQSA
ncbi:MAG: HD domain-containing protein, partial [Dehalococcoidales bacterium]|nr:HD domain-containing protein [Dehalococcoidales bacterium]